MDWHARARGRTKSSLWRRVDADVPARVESATLLSGSRFVSFRVYSERERHEVLSGPLFLTRGARWCV